MQCAADNSIIIRLNISDGLSSKFPLHTYSSRGCQECHNFSEVIITCKPFMVTCVNDETITPTSSPSTKSTGLSLSFLSVSFSLSDYDNYSVSFFYYISEILNVSNVKIRKNIVNVFSNLMLNLKQNLKDTFTTNTWSAFSNYYESSKN